MRLRSLSQRGASKKSSDKGTKQVTTTLEDSCDRQQVSSPSYYRADVPDNQGEMITSASTNYYYDDHRQNRWQQSSDDANNMHNSYEYHQGSPQGYRALQPEDHDTSPDQTIGAFARNAPLDSYGDTSRDRNAGHIDDQTYPVNDELYVDGRRDIPYRNYHGAESGDGLADASPTSTADSPDDASVSIERDMPVVKPFNKKNLKRHRLSHSETRFLLNQFGQNPHPDAAQRVVLSKQISNLSVRQIQVWFQNRRAKLKRMSASDADRMLSTRSYPEGYGPKGFESKPGRPDTPDRTSPDLEPTDAHYTEEDHEDTQSLQPKSIPSAIPQYLSHSNLNITDQSGGLASYYHRPYLRSPLINENQTHSHYTQIGQVSNVNEGTNPIYGEAQLSRVVHTPTSLTPAYDNINYGFQARSPALQNARVYYTRPYPATHPVYAPRSVNSNSEYNDSPAMTPVVQSPYRPYDSRNYYNPAIMAAQNFDGGATRQMYNSADQASAYQAPEQENIYFPNTIVPRPLGYSQQTMLGTETGDTRGLDTPASSPDGSYHQAPQMQREIKCGYAGINETTSENDEYMETAQGYTQENRQQMNVSQQMEAYERQIHQSTYSSSQQEYGTVFVSEVPDQD